MLLLNVVIAELLEFSKINVLFEHSGIIVSETDLGNSRFVRDALLETE